MTITLCEFDYVEFNRANKKKNTVKRFNVLVNILCIHVHDFANVYRQTVQDHYYKLTEFNHKLLNIQTALRSLSEGESAGFDTFRAGLGLRNLDSYLSAILDLFDIKEIVGLTKEMHESLREYGVYLTGVNKPVCTEPEF